VERAVEEAGAAVGGRAAQKVLERAEGVAALGGEEGLIGGVVFEVAFEAVEEDELLGGFAGNGARDRLGGEGGKENDVEGDAGVAGVAVVAVGRPVARVEMDFDVAADGAAVEVPLGAAEVGTFVEVPAAGVAQAEGFAGEGTEAGGAEIAAEPDFLEHALGNGVRAVEALHFSEGRGGRVVGEGRQVIHRFHGLAQI